MTPGRLGHQLVQAWLVDRGMPVTDSLDSFRINVHTNDLMA